MSNQIPKKKLELLNNIDNYFDVSHSVIDPFKIDEYDRENIIRIIKLLLHKINHFSSDLISRKINSEFDDLDFVNLIKYPLVATYNAKTKRVIINLKPLGKKEITNVDPRTLYSLIFYGYILKLFYHKPLNINTNIEVCDYFREMFIALFGKKYGIMASYVDMIPKLHFILISYVMTSFYGLNQNTTYNKASRSQISVTKFNVDFDNYDLYKSKNLIKILSESGVFPGIDISYFVGYLLNRFGLISLPMIEDQMRFMATLSTSVLPSGGLFSNELLRFNPKLSNKIIKIIEPYI